eukprot:gene13970-15427_t
MDDFQCNKLAEIPKDQVFFIYDTAALKSEWDDPKRAILFFNPSSVDLQDQCSLCGQLVGMAEFTENIFSSKPCIFKLRKGKFAIKFVSHFILALGGKLSDQDNLLSNLLEDLHCVFQFYHKSFKNIEQESKDSKDFSPRMLQIWSSYLPFAKHYAQDLFTFLDIVPYTSFNKAGSFVYLKAINILEACKRRSYVHCGCIITSGKIIASQVHSKILRYLSLLKPNQDHLPVKQFNTGMLYVISSDIGTSTFPNHELPTAGCVTQTRTSSTAHHDPSFIPIPVDRFSPASLQYTVVGSDLPHGVRIYPVYLPQDDYDVMLAASAQSPYSADGINHKNNHNNHPGTSQRYRDAVNDSSSTGGTPQKPRTSTNGSNDDRALRVRTQSTSDVDSADLSTAMQSVGRDEESKRVLTREPSIDAAAESAGDSAAKRGTTVVSNASTGSNVSVNSLKENADGEIDSIWELEFSNKIEDLQDCIDNFNKNHSERSKNANLLRGIKQGFSHVQILKSNERQPECDAMDENSTLNGSNQQMNSSNEVNSIGNIEEENASCYTQAKTLVTSIKSISSERDAFDSNELKIEPNISSDQKDISVDSSHVDVSKEALIDEHVLVNALVHDVERQRRIEVNYNGLKHTRSLIDGDMDGEISSNKYGEHKHSISDCVSEDSYEFIENATTTQRTHDDKDSSRGNPRVNGMDSSGKTQEESNCIAHKDENALIEVPETATLGRGPLSGHSCLLGSDNRDVLRSSADSATCAGDVAQNGAKIETTVIAEENADSQSIDCSGYEHFSSPAVVNTGAIVKVKLDNGSFTAIEDMDVAASDPPTSPTAIDEVEGVEGKEVQITTIEDNADWNLVNSNAEKKSLTNHAHFPVSSLTANIKKGAKFKDLAGQVDAGYCSMESELNKKRTESKESEVNTEANEDSDLGEAEDDLVCLHLYVQAHSNTVLVLFLEPQDEYDKKSLKSITVNAITLSRPVYPSRLFYETILPQLGELEVHAQNILDAQEETKMEDFVYLRNNRSQRKCKSNCQFISQKDWNFGQTVQMLHSQFNNSADFIDATFRNYTTAVYGRRTGDQETYYQQRGSYKPLQGSPTPYDMSCVMDRRVEDVVRKSISNDRIFSFTEPQSTSFKPKTKLHPLTGISITNIAMDHNYYCYTLLPASYIPEDIHKLKLFYKKIVGKIEVLYEILKQLTDARDVRRNIVEKLMRFSYLTFASRQIKIYVNDLLEDLSRSHAALDDMNCSLRIREINETVLEIANSWDSFFCEIILMRDEVECGEDVEELKKSITLHHDQLLPKMESWYEKLVGVNNSLTSMLDWCEMLTQEEAWLRYHKNFHVFFYENVRFEKEFLQTRTPSPFSYQIKTKTPESCHGTARKTFYSKDVAKQKDRDEKKFVRKIFQPSHSNRPSFDVTIPSRMSEFNIWVRRDGYVIPKLKRSKVKRTLRFSYSD